MQHLTENRKTLRLLLIATATSFILIYAGHWLAYTYVHGKGLNDKSEFIEVSLIDSLIIMPGISMIAGAVFGFLEERDRFWMAGVSMLPLLAFMLSRSFGGAIIFLSCTYLFLSLLTSWLIAWFMKWRKAQRPF